MRLAWRVLLLRGDVRVGEQRPSGEVKRRGDGYFSIKFRWPIDAAAWISPPREPDDGVTRGHANAVGAAQCNLSSVTASSWQRAGVCRHEPSGGILKDDKLTKLDTDNGRACSRTAPSLPFVNASTSVPNSSSRGRDAWRPTPLLRRPG